MKEQIRKWLWKQLKIDSMEHHLIIDRERLNKRIKFLESLVSSGIDVHVKSESWAVLCLAGKPEFVKFYRLPQKDMQYLLDTMRELEKRYGNVISDVPPFAREYLRF